MKLSIHNLNQMSLEFNPIFFTLFYESSASRFLATLRKKVEVIGMLDKIEVLNIDDEGLKVMTLQELDA